MKIRGTQASPWWSLAIFLHKVNQANNRLPLTNVASEFSFSAPPPPPRPPTTVKLTDQDVNTGIHYRNWIDEQKWQLEKQKQSPFLQGAEPPHAFSVSLTTCLHLSKEM